MQKSLNLLSSKCQNQLNLNLKNNKIDGKILLVFFRFFYKKSSLNSSGKEGFNFQENRRLSQHQKDCLILEVAENCDESQARESFIKLAKIFHPDSRSPEANNEKFQEIDAAYKNLQKKFANDRHNRWKIEGEYGLYYQEKKAKEEVKEEENLTNDPEEFNIKHTAPQHRQYLSYEGLGIGNPQQREKQYQKYKAVKASNNLLEHRLNKACSTPNQEETALAKDQRAARKIKTQYGFDRLVEDLIQEAMSKGEFNNLSGIGKPLKSNSNYNPFVDFTTHKLNQVLIDNGFTPDWILLDKEIREDVAKLRTKLSIKRHSFGENLSEGELEEWNKFLKELRPLCDDINKTISKYNLVVPILNKQMVNIELERREAPKALKNYSQNLKDLYDKNEHIKNKSLDKNNKINQSYTIIDNDTLLGFFISLISRNKN